MTEEGTHFTAQTEEYFALSTPHFHLWSIYGGVHKVYLIYQSLGFRFASADLTNVDLDQRKSGYFLK